jgi:hypothetical protein
MFHHNLLPGAACNPSMIASAEVFSSIMAVCGVLMTDAGSPARQRERGRESFGHRADGQAGAAKRQLSWRRAMLNSGRAKPAASLEPQQSK